MSLHTSPRKSNQRYLFEILSQDSNFLQIKNKEKNSIFCVFPSFTLPIFESTAVKRSLLLVVIVVVLILVRFFWHACKNNVSVKLLFLYLTKVFFLICNITCKSWKIAYYLWNGFNSKYLFIFFQVKSEGKRPNFLFGNVDFAHDDDEDDSDCEEYLVESEKAGSAGGESKTHAGMRNTVSGDSNFDIREGVRISDWCSQSRVLGFWSFTAWGL